MFSEDYLMRIISQALAALMTAAGLRKAGKYEEARQAIEQALEQLTMLPAGVVDMMEDSVLLEKMKVNDSLDVGRLETLADLYNEEGLILTGMDHSVQAQTAFSRALRFFLETALSPDAGMTDTLIAKIEALLPLFDAGSLPIDTQLALSDYYQRLLDKDDSFLAANKLSRDQLRLALENLQNSISSAPLSQGG